MQEERQTELCVEAFLKKTVGALLKPLGAFLGSLAAVLGCPGPFLGLLGRVSGDSWGDLGTSWGGLGTSWGDLARACCSNGFVDRFWYRFGAYLKPNMVSKEHPHGA